MLSTCLRGSAISASWPSGCLPARRTHRCRAVWCMYVVDPVRWWIRRRSLRNDFAAASREMRFQHQSSKRLLSARESCRQHLRGNSRTTCPGWPCGNDWAGERVEQRLLNSADLVVWLPKHSSRATSRCGPRILHDFSDLVGQNHHKLRRSPSHQSIVLTRTAVVPGGLVARRPS